MLLYQRRLRSIAAALAVSAGLAFAISSTPVFGKAGGAAAAPKLYSPAQANTGEKLYASKCAMCHGANLEGGAGPPLSGPNLTTLGEKTHLTIGDMFTYITTNMPMNAPASLSKEQYGAIMAYILKFNGYPPGTKPLTYAAASSNKTPVRAYK